MQPLPCSISRQVHTQNALAGNGFLDQREHVVEVFAPEFTGHFDTDDAGGRLGSCSIIPSHTTHDLPYRFDACSDAESIYEAAVLILTLPLVHRFRSPQKYREMFVFLPSEVEAIPHLQDASNPIRCDPFITTPD
jgi:hypothetical protein